jgi:uncharacterized phage protein (TIGR01671 family)
MREILFRGKRIDNGEWVESDCIMQFEEHPIKKCRVVQLWVNGEGWVDVIPETLGQFTCLTDKNGKRIFEGDIVKREFTLWHGETKKTRETQIGVVVYSNRECGFQVEKKCNLRKPWDGDTIQVIGNIHDNPELLEGKK